MLLGTPHLAFSCSSRRAVPFGCILSNTRRSFNRYSSLTSIFWVTCGESHPSLRIRALLFIYWPEWVCVLLMYLWGSFLFFDRVHFIPLTFHTFFSLSCSYSLHSWTLPKRGIFVGPLKWGTFLLFYFLLIHHALLDFPFPCMWHSLLSSRHIFWSCCWAPHT